MKIPNDKEWHEDPADEGEAELNETDLEDEFLTQADLEHDREMDGYYDD